MAGISTLGQALRQIENIKAQQIGFSNMSVQMATGKKTQSYAGLNTDVLSSIRSRNQYASLGVYANNITRADITINLMLTTVEEYQAQAGKFSNTVINFVQKGAHQQGQPVLYDDPATSEVEETIVGYTSAGLDNDLESVVDHATTLYDFMIDLLNTQQEDRYILAGADSKTKPLNNNGTLDAAINTLISDWKNGTITTDDLIADIRDRSALDGNPNALSDAVMGYSSSLTSGDSGKVFIRASENTEFDYTALANEQGFRDLIVALAFIKNTNLTPIVDTYEDGVYPGVPDVKGAPGATAAEQQSNFYSVFNELVEMVGDSIDLIDQVRYRLETTRAQMTETKESHTNQQNLLLNTVASVEDVDVNEVAVKLQTLKTQLETSYQVTSIASQLSLINYL